MKKFNPYHIYINVITLNSKFVNVTKIKPRGCMTD